MAEQSTSALHVRPGQARNLYRLIVVITLMAIVGDATTSWWMQRAGAGEMNPLLIAVKAEVGLFGMVAVLILTKAFLLAVIGTLACRRLVRQTISRVGDRRDLDAHLRRGISPRPAQPEAVLVSEPCRRTSVVTLIMKNGQLLHSQAQAQDRNGSERGFTLIELTIAIVVVAILSAVALVGIAGLSRQGSVSACAASADAARSASLLYYANTNGTYPTRWSDLITPKPPIYELTNGVTINRAVPTELDGRGWKLTMTGGGAIQPTFTCK